MSPDAGEGTVPGVSRLYARSSLCAYPLARLGRRTTLTLPLFPPPQKN